MTKTSKVKNYKAAIMLSFLTNFHYLWTGTKRKWYTMPFIEM